MTFRLPVGSAAALALACVAVWTPLAACSAQPVQSAATEPSRGTAILGEAAILAAAAAEVTPLMADGRYQSVSGAVVYQGRVHTFHYGRSPSGRAPDDQTLYEIGSLTKTFTGLLLA